MNYMYFSDDLLDTYPVCFLAPTLSKESITKYYIEPSGINKNSILAVSLYQDKTKKKTSKKDMVRYVEEELIEIFKDFKIEYLIIADADYFKTITGQAKAEAILGYVIPTIIDGIKAIYVPSIRSIYYNPEPTKVKIQTSLDALTDYHAGTYFDPGTTIIQSAVYPKDYGEISRFLDHLHQYPVLTCDVETFDLKHYKAGLGTISFSWSKHDGGAFAVDYELLPEPIEGMYAIEAHNAPIRKLLKEFFETYKGKLIFHNTTFDSYILIYQLFMDDLLDQEGLLKGLEVITRDNECTKIISYLATNTCAGNELGLKAQAQEFAGNYAVDDIKDIRLIPLPKLLEYNLVDTLSTFYVFEKNTPIMDEDDQRDIYENIFKPAVIDVIQMQLTGMPLNNEEVKKTQEFIQDDLDQALSIINNNKYVQQTLNFLADQWVIKRNSELKVKRVIAEDFTEPFNPGSGTQVAILLHDILGLPILQTTPTKQPSTKKKVVAMLINHTDDPEIKELLQAFVDFADASKILDAFIPAFLNAPRGNDGWHYLFGFFNLGGTVSGRLSSNNVNLQQLPASQSKYAKPMKRCFSAPPGWVFVGLDFDSMEDKVSALTTKDPNKLLIYTDGFDGHSYRTFYYFPEQLTDIDGSCVKSVNSIGTLYPDLRNESKEPTFALTYRGTYRTMMRNLGWSYEKAKGVEDNYTLMYAVSVQYVTDKLTQASKDGYVTVAFGLRVRTPLIHQSILGTGKTPREAEAEGRTAGNALGQSYGLLNTRAGSEVMGQIRKSKYALQIKPCAQIHDAQYYLIKDNVDNLEYLNKIVVDAAQWQDLPELEHPLVKMSGSLDIFYPDWSKGHSVVHNASQSQLITLAQTIVTNTNK